MDVLRLCGVELAEAFARHAAYGRFVPVQRIDNMDTMSRDVAACLAPGGEEMDHPSSQLYDLAAYVFGELGANVRQHSRGVGYVVAQMSRNEGFVRLAVADNGTGIRQSFVDAGLSWSHGMSDTDAIRKALEPRISSKGEPVNQGVGLTLVSSLARLTRAWLLIVSGNGVVQVNPQGEVVAGALPPGSAFRGTLVALTFLRSNLLNFYELLHQAKQVSGLLVKRPITNRFT